jgi:hypothetical protein
MLMYKYILYSLNEGSVSINNIIENNLDLRITDDLDQDKSISSASFLSNIKKYIQNAELRNKTIIKNLESDSSLFNVNKESIRRKQINKAVKILETIKEE